MRDIVYIVTAIFQILVLMLSIYYVVLSFFAFTKNEYETKSKKLRKFALIIAAHNEEKVIEKSIESLKNLNYPKEYYDIYLIADNCTDKTSYIGKKVGANVYEREDNKKRGKGYALEWMFNNIFNMKKRYDGICIFDADNIVDKEFLKKINAKMDEGYKVVQGYIDSKNPYDSWITQSYSIAFWSGNRLIQQARHNLEFSSQLGGTGFAVESSLLKKIGWGATCLTEDLEFTCKLVLMNEKVAYCNKAIVYDEKPLTLKQSWVQRRRWMQGFADVWERFFLKLVKKGVKEKDFKAIDCALYLSQPFVLLLLTLSIVVTYIAKFFPHFNIFSLEAYIPNIMLFFGLIQFLLTPIAMKIDKKINNTMFFILTLFSLYGIIPILSRIIFKGIGNEIVIIFFIYICSLILLSLIFMKKENMRFFVRYILYQFYTITWIPITIQGIIKRKDKNWSHTKHTRKIGINEIK